MFDNYPSEIEQATADIMLATDLISVAEIGSENTYYYDVFDNSYYCKNYPSDE